MKLKQRQNNKSVTLIFSCFSALSFLASCCFKVIHSLQGSRRKNRKQQVHRLPDFGFFSLREVKQQRWPFAGCQVTWKGPEIYPTIIPARTLWEIAACKCQQKLVLIAAAENKDTKTKSRSKMYLQYPSIYRWKFLQTIWVRLHCNNFSDVLKD